MHVHCPHCQNAIEIVDDSELNDLTCPSCGSGFSLIGEQTTLKPNEPPVKTLGRFELIEKLGIGSFGTVWKGRDHVLDRWVAIKIPRKGQLSSEEGDQFLREARSAAQLNHPQIVSIHEVGRHEETIYIVSDFISGCTLDDRLSRGPISFSEGVRLSIQLAAAMEYAHDRGVVHRDIKPSNVMLDDRGQPHLMDFGLAKREAGEITMTFEGRILGTPAYMSPEQAKGEGHQADRRSDVYSLGVILFELLTGERPFRGNVNVLIQQVLNDEVPSPRKFNAKIPRDLETICLKCLEKLPTKRYQRCADLQGELERWERNEPIMTRPINRLERGWRWCKRNPRVAIWCLAFFLTLTLGTIFSVYYAVAATKAAQSAERNREEASRLRELEAQANQELEKQLLRADQINYSMEIQLANSAWENNDVAIAFDALENCDWLLRGWEHDYLFTKFNQSQRTLYRHADWVNDIAIDEGGERLLTAGEDGRVCVWNLKQDVMQARIEIPRNGDSYGIYCVAISPNGRVIASGTQSNEVAIWDTDSGRKITELIGHQNRVTSLAFSASGKWLVSGSEDNSVRIWSVADWSEKRQFLEHTDWVSAVAFSPRGDRVASCGRDGSIRLWNVSTDVPTRVLPVGEYVNTIAFSHDGTKIASGDHRDQVKIWDSTSGDLLISLSNHEAPVVAVAFSPDDRFLVTGGWDDKLILWDVENGRVVSSFKGHAGSVNCLTFSPDGQLVYSGSGDRRVRQWRVFEPQGTPKLFGHTSWVNCVTVSPNGSLFASGQSYFEHNNDKSILWEGATGKTLFEFDGHTNGIRTLEFSPDNRALATGDGVGTVHVWNVVDGSCQSEYKPHEGAVRSLNFLDQGRSIVTGGPDGRVCVWNLAGSCLAESFQAKYPTIWHATASADGKRLFIVSVSPDEEQIALEHVSRQLDDGSSSVLNNIVLDFSPTAFAINPSQTSIAIGNYAGDIRLVGTTDGQPICRLESVHVAGILALEFSPDGALLVSSSLDNTIRIWDLTSGLQLLSINDETVIDDLAFSPDGKTILGAGRNDGAVRVWRADFRLPLSDRQAFLLNSEAWHILSDQHSPRIRLKQASEKMDLVCRRFATSDYLCTLGFAKYRNGAFEDAIQTCERSLAMESEAVTTSRTTVLNFAVLAMSHLENNNNTDEASRFYNLFESAMQASEVKNDIAFQRLGNEVKELFRTRAAPNRRSTIIRAK